jgi:hypothetical protein
MYEQVKFVRLFTKENGRIHFFSEYGDVYVKEEEDRIVMSDRKDFMNFFFWEHADLNEYRIMALGGPMKKRTFVEVKEDV